MLVGIMIHVFLFLKYSIANYSYYFVKLLTGNKILCSFTRYLEKLSVQCGWIREE